MMTWISYAAQEGWGTVIRLILYSCIIVIAFAISYLEEDHI